MTAEDNPEYFTFVGASLAFSYSPSGEFSTVLMMASFMETWTWLLNYRTAQYNTVPYGKKGTYSERCASTYKEEKQRKKQQQTKQNYMKNTKLNGWNDVSVDCLSLCVGCVMKTPQPWVQAGHVVTESG